MLLKRGLEMTKSSKIMTKLVASIDYVWAVANGKLSVFLKTCWYMIKSYRSKKLTKSYKLLLLCLIEKDNWGNNGKRFEKSDY